MLQTLRNAWRLEELRKKIIFTVFIILLFRLGNAIPVPHINVDALQAYFTQVENTVLGLYNVMSGGAFSTATIFALSIQPYINASIIMQLLTIAIPALERMSKEGGEEGKKKIAAITRYVTVGIGLLMGIGYYFLMKNQIGIIDPAVADSFWAAVVIVLSFTSGSALVMWLGEQINEHGIGNGISLILFAGIISRMPNTLISNIVNIANGQLQWWVFALMLLGALAIVVLIVIVNDSERRIPVQYAKRVVGRKMYGGQGTHLPIKLNMTGVMPIIFASSIVSVPATIATFFDKESGFYKFVNTWLGPNSWVYVILYVVLIVAFSYFYVLISFNPMEVANNIKNNGGSVPGIRTGRPTAEYITKILNRITLIGAFFLIIVAGLPMVANIISGGTFASLAFGGSSLLIVVGVAIETFRDIEAQITMRNYKGFLD